MDKHSHDSPPESPVKPTDHSPPSHNKSTNGFNNIMESTDIDMERHSHTSPPESPVKSTDHCSTRHAKSHNGSLKRSRKFQRQQSIFQLPRIQKRQPCTITCFSKTCRWPQLLTWSKCCEQKVDDDVEIEDEPFRKKCSRACFTFVYIALAAIAVFVTYSMIQDLVISMQYPVRSIQYTQVTEYEAPGRLLSFKVCSGLNMLLKFK